MKTLIAAYSGVLRGERRAEAARSENKNKGSALSREGLVPYSKPITTVVGEPITVPKLEHPTQKDIDLYHAMYMEALVKLFDNHKTKFGLPETEVLEVN